MVSDGFNELVIVINICYIFKTSASSEGGQKITKRQIKLEIISTQLQRKFKRLQMKFVQVYEVEHYDISKTVVHTSIFSPPPLSKTL